MFMRVYYDIASKTHENKESYLTIRNHLLRYLEIKLRYLFSASGLTCQTENTVLILSVSIQNIGNVFLFMQTSFFSKQVFCS